MFALTLLAAWLGACGRCGETRAPVIATLSALGGEGVLRDFAANPQLWQPAQRGDGLSLGDGARTDARSTAELTFIDGTQLALQPSTTVRLLSDPGAGSQTAFDIQAGEALLRSGGGGTSLRTHVGLAVLSPNSEVRLARRGDALGFQVALGSLTFRDRDARDVGLESGDSVSIGIGMAVLSLDRKKTAPSDRGIAVEVARGSARASTHEGEERVLEPGSHLLAPGTALHLASESELRIPQGGGALRLSGAADLIVGAENALAEARRGAMQLEAADVDIVVRVPGGIIVARAGATSTRANVEIGPEQGRLEVVRGHVSAKLDGRSEELEQGAERTWTHTQSESIESGPRYHHMSARAGASFAVHTPEVPVAIRLEFGRKCRGEGVLELVGGRQHARGREGASLAFGAGVRSYTLRCAGARGRVVARGRVHVIVDAGTRRLPPQPPTSVIDADGRTYRIYYPNQLPEVLVRWPMAPAQGAYELRVDGRPITLTTPEHRFPSGTLGDGTHELVFEAKGRRSRTTKVEVRFDNVAPKASLTAPENRGFSSGEKVHVEGVALPGWKVAIEGGAVEMGGGQRFSADVQTSTAQPDIVVRLHHPRLGTHYYLRRASGSP